MYVALSLLLVSVVVTLGGYFACQRPYYLSGKWKLVKSRMTNRYTLQHHRSQDVRELLQVRSVGRGMMVCGFLLLAAGTVALFLPHVQSVFVVDAPLQR